MGLTIKSFTLILVFILAASSLIIIKPGFAQTLTPSSPEPFITPTLLPTIVDNSSNVGGQVTAIIATISVGSNPNGIVYDSGKGEIFVANHGSNSVSVISDSDNSVVATIGVGPGPMGLAYDSGKGEIFVSNNGDSHKPFGNTVSIISDETNTVVANVTVGRFPSSMTYDSGKGEIYVACDNSVSIISDETNTQIATVRVGNVPRGMAYDSSKGEVYVTNMADNTVSVISDITHSVIATVNMVPKPNIYSSLPQACAAAYDSANRKIYVAIPYKDRVSTISDRTHTVIENISVGIAPQDIVYNSGTKEIFVLSRESIGPNQNLSTLSILSDTTNKVVATVNLNQSWAISLAYDFGKGEIFLTDSSINTVIVIAHSSITYSAPTELDTFTKITIVVIVILFAAITVSLLLFRRHRKTANLKQ